MRLPSLIATIVILHASASAIAGETRSKQRVPLSDVERELILPARAIAGAVEPWTPDVRACWLEHATRPARADGRLRVEIIIAATGEVWRQTFVFAGGRNRPLERCLGRVVAQWRFPMRRGYTAAAVPYLFRASPNKGPFPSCWSPRGCARRAPPRP